MSKKNIEQKCNFKTQRLFVKSWTNELKGMDSDKSFAKEVIEILTPNVTKSLPDGWQNVTNLAGAQDWIKERDQESHFITIQLLATEETIGFIFLYEANSEQNYYDLRFGYLLSEKVWGNGLGTELIRGLIKWCREEGDIKSISGGVEVDNIGSIKVLEKTGFSKATAGESKDDVIFYEYKFE